MSRLPFVLEHSFSQSGTRARAGKLTTLHNEVQTPVFMPVGTQATVKSQTPDSLQACGAKILLANTYHLLLRPGREVFEKLGGIHRFMQWPNSVLTDSGGYQIFSLENMRHMTEEGAKFKSYVDGQDVLLTPELSIQMQRAIGSDIMMALDQCVPSTCDRETAKHALELTTRWARRSLKARGESPQALFGITQGACFEDLRRESAEQITSLPFDGFAIGGLAVGESRAEREDMCELAASLLPADRPRYLMGVGTPIDLLEAVHRGVDMFDCIIPTNFAQRGVVFTSRGKIHLGRSVYKDADEALDPACSCTTCMRFSKAYLHHLFKASENLGWTLLAYHNLWFYQKLMATMRAHIVEGTFANYYQHAREELIAGDLDHPVTHPKRKRRGKKEMFVLGDYQVIVHENPTYGSIQQISSKEVMHSVSDPMVEATELYVKQSQIVSRSFEQDLTIWDVGLGAATNVMATILAFEKSAANNPGLADRMKPLEIISFEIDMDPMTLAMRHTRYFPQSRHPAGHYLLEHGEYRHEKLPIHWRLVRGDFRQTHSREKSPDIVYYDPFSFKTDAPLWEQNFLRELFLQFTREPKLTPVELFTYTSSTAIRSAFLAAGFFVARGLPTGPKRETTIAATSTQFQRHWLDSTWLAHWHRSGARRYDQEVLAHAQFQSMTTSPEASV